MPGKVKVKIISGRNLPVMDRSSDTTDAYVEIKLGSTTYKTDVCRKSLHPQWNTEWYRFEVDDSELQDEPLQIRLMDHDTYSANDAIGKVYLNLNPLLLPAVSHLNKWNGESRSRDNVSSNTSTMSGWLPVYDTMHGIRGEVDITVKVEHFSDFNKFRQSSCGIQFFFSPAVPHGFYAHTVHGFVEELIVNDDPEYQWIDKIRTPRASNEARQTLFCKLAGELQRKIGVKALDLGGNAVIGYRQSFDLEGESGIVARGIGTAITLVKISLAHGIPGSTAEELNGDELDEDQVPPLPIVPMSASPPCTPPPAQPSVPISQPQPIVQQHTHQRSESVGASSGGARIIPPALQAPLQTHSPTKMNSIHRRSSDSDLSITSKGNSLTGSDRSGGYSSGHYMRANNALIRSTVPQENFDILEYPFLTMSQYPPGFISFLGGAVNARSVKLLERITNLEEPESRDIWWSEIRMEIRSHARALNCNAVLGYKETTSICEEVCVLSASGTAAIIGYQSCDTIDLNYPSLAATTVLITDNMTASLDRNDFEKERLIAAKTTELSAPNTPQFKTTLESSDPDKDIVHPVSIGLGTAQVSSQGCTICHLPYKAKVAQLRNTTSKCSVCRLRKVPDVLIATIELPEGIPTQGRGCFLQSYVCRPLKDLKGESNAKEISDGLPFLEYELHRLLLNKLKVKGMNAIFGLNVRISIGERMLIGIATGTAVFLTPLPAPPIPKLRSTDEEKLAKLQKKLHETVKKNKEIYQLVHDLDNNKVLSDDDSDDDRPAMDLNSGNKDCCVLEVDDPEDVTELNLLMEPRPPDGFHVVNTERVPGGLEDLEIVKNLQMFTQVWRSRIQPPYNFDHHFHRLLQTVYFKLRRMVPCALCHLQFRVESPEPDEIQLCVLGMALGLGDPEKNSKSKRKNAYSKKTDEDLIFNIDDDLIPENSTTNVNTNYLHTTQNLKHRQKSPVRNKFVAKQQHHLPYKERHGVDITPLSYVPGGKIEKYLGNLNFFFIRETNSIREEGGLSGFMHSFITEVLAIVRSHVTALGGNAMVAYYLTECTLNHNLHKNQGQCLINVGGDVVFVSYYSDDH